ncbi:MAG: c-type cytochrome [Terriglobia bacterium]
MNLKTLLQTSAALAVLVASLVSGPASFAAASTNATAQLFKANCSRCHGVDGKGIAAIHTPNFTGSKWQAMRSDKRLLSMITHGEKGTAMPAWKGKLTTTQIRALVHYVRSLKAGN